MKLSTKLKTLAVAALAAGTLLVVGAPRVALARTAYNPNGTPTSTTPVFNEFYNVPDGVGDEADFVRIKPKASGNSAYVSDLNAACNAGDTFTVRIYVHNGADPSFNNNGTGSAVAHNVIVATTNKIGETRSSFPFTGTVTANNAATVTDAANLICGKTVKLSYVLNSTQTYSKTLGFLTEGNGFVNNSRIEIGSRVHGSGDVWACWDDRVIVTYDVKVEETPPVVEVKDATCDLLNIVVAGRKVTVRKEDIKSSATNATVNGARVDFGEGVTTTTFPAEHTYTTDGEKTIRATVLTSVGEKTSDSCVKKVTFTKDQPPKTPPVLPKTGAGSVVGIFAAATVAGALVHRYILGRKFNS